jgi:TrmH family RNA methyltransferase
MQPLPLVTSLSNLSVKQARGLRQRKARAESGLFLVEGLHHVGEALEAGWQIQSLFYAPDLLESGFGTQLVARAEKEHLHLQPVTRQVMESLAEKDNPQGLLAVVAQRRSGLEALEPARSLVALVSPQDPGNVGAILRTMDAAGVDGLCLLDTSVDLYHPGVVRASMGTLFWKPIAQAAFAEFADWAAGRGFQLIGTSAHAQADYRAFRPREPWALLMGSEQKGLSTEQMAACEVSLSLPMRGRVSSLNLAVATGILLYKLSG